MKKVFKCYARMLGSTHNNENVSRPLQWAMAPAIGILGIGVVKGHPDHIMIALFMELENGKECLNAYKLTLDVSKTQFMILDNEHQLN